MNRISILEEILDRHIEHLNTKLEPILNDTKQLVELLKSTNMLEEIKRNKGESTPYDNLSLDDLKSTFNIEDDE